MKNLVDSRILMISQDPGLRGVAGYGDVIERHSQYASHINRLDIFVFSKKGEAHKKLSANCQVYGFTNSLSGLWQAFRMGNKLSAEHKYDLIDTQDPHITGLLGYLLARQFKTKLEVHMHGDFLHNPNWSNTSLKNRFYSLFQNIILRKSDAIRVVNQLFIPKLEKIGIQRQKIAVINTPVNEQAFIKESIENTELRARLGDRKNLLFIGRLVPVKNLLGILDIVKNLSKKRNDFRFVIVGDGELKDKLSEKIDRENLQDFVSMEGAVEHKYLLDYLRLSYIFLLLSQNESFGKVIIEAGFLGVPTLASATAGPSNIIVDGQTGWLVPINDMTAAEEKINELLDNADLVQRVGESAKQEFLANFSQAASINMITSFWTKIINNQL